MKKLLFLLLLLISSFAFSQENPSAVEDGIIKRCPIETKATWYSVYIGPIGIRKNITIVSDSTISGRVTKGAFKNSLGQPDTSTGYYMLGKIKQWKNRNSDYFYYRSDTTGACWIQIEYINGLSLETGVISLSDLAQLGLINGDTTYFSVLKARLGNNKIYTTGSDGRDFLITNTTNEDSARIQISLSGNGGIVVNYYGATILGNSGNPQANDSIMIKFGMNNVYWKYSTAWTTNGQIGDPTTGVGVLSPNNTDSLIFRGLTNSTSGKYNFLGNFYINGTEVTTETDSTIDPNDFASGDTLVLRHKVYYLGIRNNGSPCLIKIKNTMPTQTVTFKVMNNFDENITIEDADGFGIDSGGYTLTAAFKSVTISRSSYANEWFVLSAY